MEYSNQAADQADWRIFSIFLDIWAKILRDFAAREKEVSPTVSSPHLQRQMGPAGTGEDDDLPEISTIHEAGLRRGRFRSWAA